MRTKLRIQQTFDLFFICESWRWWTYIMSSGPKDTEEGPTGHTSVGEGKDTPLLPRGSPVVWQSTTKFHSVLTGKPGGQLRRRAVVLISYLLKWSNRDQQGLREPERDQPIQEPGRDRAYKKMLWSTVEQRAWATYRTNKSAAELHETISKEKVDFPLLTATWHRVQSQKLKWLQSEMKETAFSAYPTLLQ